MFIPDYPFGQRPGERMNVIAEEKEALFFYYISVNYKRGIDGIIKEDKLGLDFIYIQAKRWDNQAVGRPDIQSFVGALDGQRATKGIFITTSRFAENAKEYEKTITKKVILIDGDQLAEFMIDYGLGVSTSTTYDIKKIDSDYFGE